MTVRITPRYKMLLTYNILPDTHDAYFQFVTSELVPRLQGMGLHMYRVYSTEYGDYPMRQVEFLAESLDIVRHALRDPAWQRLERKLNTFVTDYKRRVVAFRQGFQL